MSLLQRLEDLDDAIQEALLRHDGVPGLLAELKNILGVAATVVNAIDVDSQLGDIIESAVTVVDGLSKIFNNDGNPAD